MGEKAGWTYLFVEADLANRLAPGVNSFFRVKGNIDGTQIERLALWPMGSGNFILPIKAPLLKGNKRKVGDSIGVSIELDTSPNPIDEDFMLCLDDVPTAKRYYDTLTPSHRKYFSQWISSAKTDATKAKRIALAIECLAVKLGFSDIMRIQKERNKGLRSKRKSCYKGQDLQ
jgi:hypothetical protein